MMEEISDEPIKEKQQKLWEESPEKRQEANENIS